MQEYSTAWDRESSAWMGREEAFLKSLGIGGEVCDSSNGTERAEARARKAVLQTPTIRDSFAKQCFCDGCAYWALLHFGG